VTGSFYATLAQVLPLLLLAFIWDSGFLVRLRRQRRLPKRDDPAGVRFWTKPRVRVYTLLVTTVVIASTAVTILVLAGLIPDSHVLRVALSSGLVLILLTLLTRITVDVLWATAAAGDSAEPAGQSPQTPAMPPAPAALPGVDPPTPAGQDLPPPSPPDQGG
jgi:hypothetical protein